MYPKDSNLSYLTLRIVVGTVGVSLPFLLVLGSGVLTSGQQWFQYSISHYYYSKMHFLFMFSLIILGITLVVYNGNHYEERLSSIAGISAWMVAMFPTRIEDFMPAEGESYLYLTPRETSFWGGVHYATATILFLCFAIFCFRVFTKADILPNSEDEKNKKRRRNVIYKTCGWIILTSISIIGGAAIWNCSNMGRQHPLSPFLTIAFETSSLLAFGISWLLKGSLKWPQSRYKILKMMVKG